MQIVLAPHDVLAQKAEPIKKIDKTILTLIEEMKETLVGAKDPEGVGLAAPQVGKSLQLFIVKPTPKSPITVYMNPKLTLHEETKKIPAKKSEDDEDVQLEGCLSLKDIWGTVQRAQKVTISYMNEAGEEKEETKTGFPAVILQHEYDHLQGILFPRRVLEQKGTLYKSHKDKNGDDIFEPVTI